MLKPSQVSAMRRAVREDQRLKQLAAQSEPVLDEGHLAALVEMSQNLGALVEDLEPSDPPRAELERVLP